MQLITKKFTVKTYEKMLENNIFKPQERLELIRGEIIQMSPIGLKHATTVIRLTNLFPILFQDKALISVQNSIILNNNSEPEPDLVILKNKEDFYAEGRPTPEDILLLIEVSDSTLKYDQEIKLPLYAESKVNEVWIINLNNSTIEVYRQPKNNFYQQRQILTETEKISCLAFPEIEISIINLFPKS